MAMNDDLEQQLAPLLGSLEAQPPPPALRGQVLEAALRRRAAGSSPDPDPSIPIDPVDVFGLGVAASVAEVERLAGSMWSAPLLRREWNVQEMIGHLLGAARYMAGALGLDDPIEGVPLAEHVPFTQQWIDRHRGASPDDTAAAFIASFTSLADAASRLRNADLATATEYYGFEIARGTALVAASFELWAHVDDIRRAVGNEPHPLSPEELSIMCRLAAGVLPFTLGYVGTPHLDRTARLVLTGPGGGTFVVTTGGESRSPGDEDALIVTDALDFCRIAGRHLDVDEVAHEVEGDQAFARDLLASARVLAA
jgi:uncharacterized protein (TIGR03083 family)